ncbi:unnamed protein product [Effrenium voratum]|uniref:Uncharacterized protein n=1 Tax=Effrenium voratum TaxID=2562239 RepID=A0AA36MQZ0_9DINO|nr:unnamed protein product [Effrenium voratum]
MSAAELREKGNTFFQAEQFSDAARCYGEALAKIRSGDAEALEVPVRLNLAAALLQLESIDDMAKVVTLCDEVLALDPSNTKAFYRRGIAQQALAQKPDGSRPMLHAARKDLLQAAKLEPSNRKVRDALQAVTKALEAPQKFWECSLLGSNLYGDRQPSKPPPPPSVCSVCRRLGHSACGESLWLTERAKWLSMPDSEVAKVPKSFEDDGTLMEAIRASREEYQCGISDLSHLSDDERDALEDCIDSIDRPFPPLKCPVSLGQAVRCAVEMWDDAGA